jgi:CRISPR/Cas system-associated exonuclease Cas4 (RecB family)
MKYDQILRPEFHDLSFEIKSHRSVGNTIERTEEHSALLNSRFLDPDRLRIFSPSAINTWLSCRMKFYYRYVNGLTEPEVVTRDIDQAMLGEILHDVMKKLYTGFISSVVTPEIADLIIHDKQLIESTIIDTITEKFSGEEHRIVEGTEYIIRDVLMAYVQKVLRTDKALSPFKILHLESAFSFPVTFSSGNSDITLLTGGKTDRIDLAGGVVRIVDYKTGTVADWINSIEDLFGDDRKKDVDAWLQTLLYCEAYLSSNQGIRLRPSVCKIRKLSASSDNDRLKIRVDTKNEIIVDDYHSVRDEFLKNLKVVISVIFGRDEPFTMTTDIRGKCSYCAYRRLCLR